MGWSSHQASGSTSPGFTSPGLGLHQSKPRLHQSRLSLYQSRPQAAPVQTSVCTSPDLRLYQFRPQAVPVQTSGCTSSGLRLYQSRLSLHQSRPRLHQFRPLAAQLQASGCIYALGDDNIALSVSEEDQSDMIL